MTHGALPIVGLAAFALLPACGGAALDVKAQSPLPSAAAYERILGAFTADPDQLILLNPIVCSFVCIRYGDRHDSELVELGRSFARVGYRRGQATAELNRGALLWFSFEPDRAYEAIASAHRMFASIGDARGMAHSFEWLGYMLLESNAVQAASEHLSVAYHLFERMQNAAAMERVAGYGG